MAGVINYLMDPHFFHEKAAEWRGFSSVEEHNDVIMDSIITQCGARDVLVFGGDVCFATADRFDDLLLRHANRKFFNGMSIIMKNAMGNHDRQRLQRSQFISTHGALFEHECMGRRVIASHIPIHPSQFPRWNINAHGHTHDDQIDDPNYVNCCWEQTGRPVTIAEVVAKHDKQIADELSCRLDNKPYVKTGKFF